MPTALRRLSSVVVLAALTVLLAACSPAAVASLIPGGTGPLVTITTRGGECMEGPCGGTTVIERDGRVHITEPEPFHVGTVSSDDLTVLDAAIKTADFDALRAVPFQG